MKNKKKNGTGGFSLTTHLLPLAQHPSMRFSGTVCALPGTFSLYSHPSMDLYLSSVIIHKCVHLVCDWAWAFCGVRRTDRPEEEDIQTWFETFTGCFTCAPPATCRACFWLADRRDRHETGVRHGHGGDVQACVAALGMASDRIPSTCCHYYSHLTTSPLPTTYPHHFPFCISSILEPLLLALLA